MSDESISEREQLTRLYADWCRSENATLEDDPRTQGWNHLALLVRDSPDEAWTFLLDAMAHLDVSEDDALDSLGADALEGLLSEHGDATLERLEQRAPHDRKLCLAARGVWLFDAPIRPRLDAILIECDARPTWLT